MKKWLPLVSICTGTFMLLIDTTIVQVALPDIATSLDASFSSLQWMMNGYVVALAALLLGAGSVADLVGQARLHQRSGAVRGGVGAVRRGGERRSSDQRDWLSSGAR
ncbi:hypothetical protein [Allokutzneria oryzae]|uniref:Major facilitator superfamily (MFS) profile domain-containing protein n=1 Tax=Allokutzneria oryzae TaxID=1378989 RepID=A0ABV5ZU25_9PSEU